MTGENPRQTPERKEFSPAREPLDPRIYFAAERTLLAWIRTGLALMGFGFVVARFGLFLQELALERGGPPIHGTNLSLWAGTTLVILGMAVNIASVINHRLTVLRLERGEPMRFQFFSLGTITAILLSFIGLGMIAYLFFRLD